MTFIVYDDLVPDKKTYSIFVEQIPVSTFSSIFTAINILGEVGLMEDCDWLFRLFEEPTVLAFIEHVLDHLSFSCAVPSWDAYYEGLAVFDREVGDYGTKFLEMEILLGCFYWFGSSHALFVIFTSLLLHLLKLSNQL